jgi:hypothetical protein
MITAAEMIVIGFFNTPRTTGSIAPIFILPLSALCRALLNKFRNIVIISRLLGAMVVFWRQILLIFEA